MPSPDLQTQTRVGHSAERLAYPSEYDEEDEPADEGCTEDVSACSAGEFALEFVPFVFVSGVLQDEVAAVNRQEGTWEASAWPTFYAEDLTEEMQESVEMETEGWSSPSSPSADLRTFEPPELGGNSGSHQALASYDASTVLRIRGPLRTASNRQHCNLTNLKLAVQLERDGRSRCRCHPSDCRLNARAR